MSNPVESNKFKTLLKEKRLFPPLKEFVKQVNWNDPKISELASKDPEGYWVEMARDL